MAKGIRTTDKGALAPEMLKPQGNNTFLPKPSLSVLHSRTAEEFT